MLHITISQRDEILKILDPIIKDSRSILPAPYTVSIKDVSIFLAGLKAIKENDKKEGK